MKPEKNKEEEQDFLSLLAEKGGFAPIKHNHKEIDVIDLDRIRWKGKFTKGQEYKVNDLVSYQGNLYICMTDNKGEAPTTNFWELLTVINDKDSIRKGDAISLLKNDKNYITELMFMSSPLSKFRNDIGFITKEDIDWQSNVPSNEKDPIFLKHPAYTITRLDIDSWNNGLAKLRNIKIDFIGGGGGGSGGGVTTETDPIFTASPAHGIDAFDIANWNTAYGWGNHAGLYELTGTASGLIGTHESTYDHTLIATALQSLDGAWLNDTNQTDLTGDKSGSFDLTTTGTGEFGDVNATQSLSGEYIANASFDTDTLFTTLSGTITWATGSYTFLASAIKSQAFSDMLIAPSSGVRRYKYEFVVSAASGISRIFFPHFPSVAISIGDPGTYTGEFDAEITDPFKFGSGSSGNGSVTIDSISIKEITKGNVYADQRMYAQRFVTEGGTSAQFVLGDGTLGSALLLDQTTPQTITGGVPNFSVGIQVSTTGGILFSDGGASSNIQFDGTNLLFYSGLVNANGTYDIGTISVPWGYVYANYFVGDGSGLTSVPISGYTTDDLTEGSTNLYFNGKTTDDLSEGSTNKYYADSLVDTWLTGKTSDDVTEGSTNLYFTSSRTTDELTEGSTNLYYTDGRVDSWLTNKGAYTGDLNDSTSTKIADVVEGLITAVSY